MAIKAYVGIMGSGKTYEVTSVVIFGALAAGRRVVSNIAGLNFDEFKKLLLEQGVPEQKIGQLVQVSHEDVLKPEFWRTDKDVEQGIDSFIQPGDLVALDEIWRFWEGFGDRKMPDRVMNFFRMHRQFTHPKTGLSCEVALITQDVMDISRKVRGVVEETYRMTKLTAIGSTSKYRVDIFQKARILKTPFRQFLRSYDPKFFDLYKSHSQKKEGDAPGVEESIDKRGNLLRGALFRFVIPVGLVVFGFAAWYIYGFFHPTPKDLPVAANGSKSPAATPVRAASSPAASDWRVVGHYRTDSGLTVLLTDGQRSRVLHNPPNIKVSALSVEVVLPDGSVAADWMSTVKSGPSVIPK